MALRQDLLGAFPRPRTITTETFKLPEGRFGPERDLAVIFSGLNYDEVAELIARAIDIEQRRSAEAAEARILSPTASQTVEVAEEMRNRFSGLDLPR